MKVITSIIFLAGLFLINTACSDTTPSCIEDRIKAFKTQNQGRSFTFIYTFEQKGKQYYIFDNGIAFDAIATVVDEDCTEVCSYGGFRANNPNPCDDFQEGINSAKQIWPE